MRGWKGIAGSGLAVVSLVVAAVLPWGGCCSETGSPEYDPRTKEATFVFLGAGAISSDGEAVCFAGQGDSIASWMAVRKVFQNEDLMQGTVFAVRFMESEGPYRALVYGEQLDDSVASGRYRTLRIVDVPTLDVLNEYRVANARARWCYVSPDKVVIPIPVNPEEEDSPLRMTVWRTDGSGIAEEEEIQVGDSGFRVWDMERVSDTVVLFYLSYPGPKRGSTGSAGASSAKKTGSRTRAELVLYDIEKHEVLARKSRPHASDASTSSLTIGARGTRALFILDDRMELYSLPTLSFEKTEKAKERLYSGLEAAISTDGRYIAVGGTSVELWDTRTSAIRTLDELDTAIVNSPVYRLRWDPPTWRRSKDFREDPFLRVTADTQYCVAALTFIKDTHQLAGVTHGGVFSVWDVDTRKLLRRERIAEVEYFGVAK